jgi:hypothetical protein
MRNDHTEVFMLSLLPTTFLVNLDISFHDIGDAGAVAIARFLRVTLCLTSEFCVTIRKTSRCSG